MPLVAAQSRGFALSGKVKGNLIDPNLNTARDFIEQHLATHNCFVGEALSMADFQMNFAVGALLARGTDASACPHLNACNQCMQARPAFQRAIAKGGPAVPA